MSSEDLNEKKVEALSPSGNASARFVADDERSAA